MGAMSDVDYKLVAEITRYYNRGREETRLSKGKNQLERLRTEELLTRFLPPSPAVTHDVGGGAGIYALWLAARG